MAQPKLTAGTAVPTTPQERTTRDYEFDIFAKCAEVLREVRTEETMVK